MTRKKVTYIFLFLIGGACIFCFLLYQTIKTKSADMSNHAPYKHWVGKNCRLLRQTYLFKNKNSEEENSQYAYTLIDSLHPQWQYYKDAMYNPNMDVQYIINIPAGTTISFKKAIQYTNGVSGSSHPTILGNISINNRTYNISYQWGEISQARYFDHIDECWKFHKAPWQHTQDTAWYALPEAKWW